MLSWHILIIVVAWNSLSVDGCYGDKCAKKCGGPRCAYRCNGRECGEGCKGGSCGESCEGWECARHCEGGRCAYQCNGRECGEDCVGDYCGYGCRGEECAKDCKGAYCAAGCSGYNCNKGCSGFNCNQGITTRKTTRKTTLKPVTTTTTRTTKTVTSITTSTTTTATTTTSTTTTTTSTTTTTTSTNTSTSTSTSTSTTTTSSATTTSTTSTTEVRVVTTNTTEPAESSARGQKSTLAIGIVVAVGLVLFLLVVCIGYRRWTDTPTNAQILSSTANLSYPDSKGAPPAQPMLVANGAYVEVELSTRAEESLYDGVQGMAAPVFPLKLYGDSGTFGGGDDDGTDLGDDEFAAAIAGFQDMPAPAPPLEPYGTLGDGNTHGAKGEGGHSVEDSAPRVINEAGTYLQFSAQQVMLYDDGAVPGIASNQLSAYAEVADNQESDHDVEHASSNTITTMQLQRCKYRQPGEGGQRCKYKTNLKWCEKHTCRISACQNSKPSKDAICSQCIDSVEVDASQPMYEPPSRRQSQLYDEGKVPGAASHFASGAYASNDQKAYRSITTTSATCSGGACNEMGSTSEELTVEEPYGESDDDDISL